MKKPFLILPAALALLMLAVILLSCEEKCTCPVEEEHIGDYHLIYSHAGGDGETSPYLVLTYSTKTGRVIDTLETNYYLRDMRFTSDGSKMVVLTGTSSPSAEPKLITVDNVSGDTLALLSVNFGGSMYLSPDETKMLVCGGSMLAIYSFPMLDIIFSEEVANDGGGFLTAGDSIYYYNYNIDSLSIIDYSNPADIIKTAIPIRSYGLPAYPTGAVTNYDRHYLFLAARFGDYTGSVLKIYDSNNIEEQNSLDVMKYYNSQPVIRPGTDEIYLCANHAEASGYDFVDLYYASLNIVITYLNAANISTEDHFKPQQVDFTPDGNLMFVMLGGGPTFSSVIGIQLSDKAIIHMLRPTEPLASFIRIDPTDYSK